MSKSLKIFMAFALALFMTLGSLPVNTVYALDGEQTTDVTDQPSEETPAPDQTDNKQEETPAESGDPAPAVETAPTAEEINKEEETTLPASEETPAEQEENTSSEKTEVVSEEEKIEAEPSETEGTDASEEKTEETAPVEEEVKEEETAEEVTEETVTLNTEAYNPDKEAVLLGENLYVVVSYPENTLPEGTEVKISEAKPEAIEALKEKYGEDISFKAADISFIYEGKEIEPKDYSENKVYVSLSYKGEEDLSDKTFETVHIAETVNEEGTLVYTPETVDAEMSNLTETKETPVYESKEITETVKEPYTYTWTEEVTKYKTERQYVRTDKVEDGTEEVPVYEERDITEEKTGYLLKTREVEKTRTVRVKVSFRLFDPSTWFGYKNVKQTYTTTETYKEPYTYTVVVGKEKVQVGTETVTKYKDVDIYQDVQVADGTETVTHTETRYKDVTKGTGRYEDVPTGEYTTEEIVVGQTSVFSAGEFSVYAIVANGFENNGEFVIYTGTTALAYSGNNLTTATVTVEDGTVVRSSSDNIVWTVSTSGQYYRLSTGSRYLQYRRNGNNDTLRTTGTAGNDGTTWQYDRINHRLYAVNGDRTRYLTYNNGSWGLTQTASQAATVYIARVQAEPATGDLTYNYYNADHSSSISAAEIVPEADYTTTWTNVSTLAKPIAGYKFLEARANSVDGSIISQVNGRSYRAVGETTGEGQELTDIFFVYMHDYVAGEDIIPGLNGPKTEKSVTQNDDGTFTIQLDITGVVNEVKHGANVVVVFDRTSSMSGNMSNSDRIMRINAAIAAVETMVTTLNPGTGENQNDIDFALVEFDRNATPYDFGSNGITGHTYWTKRGSALTARVSRYEDGSNLAPSGATLGGGGTNWQAALQATAAVLEDKPDADPTYVIFMTDGEPTIYIGSSNVRNNRSTTDPEYYASVPYANAIVAADYHMYDIFCSASSTTLLHSLYETSGADSYVMAETQTAIENAFKQVAQAMLDAIGSSNYAADDGVPELGAFEIDTVEGQLSEARYYKKEADSTEFATWDDAPAATPSEGGVKWDLSTVGTLEKDVVYRIEFEVWPSQEAYDLIADLNNGLRSYDPDGENPISAEERAQITKISETEYTLKTNTYLKASYRLYGKTHNDDVDFTEDAMDLPTKTISVQKLWPTNMLDDYGAAIYRDPETGEARTATEIELTLKRENATYLTFTVDKDHNWLKDDLYVSCGFMTVKNGEVDIKESGHDYQITEPSSFSYYWDLISDVYHPMVINGEAKVLVYDPDLTEADVANGIYEINGKIYKEQEDTSNTLKASNYRRSNLNLTKVVSTGGSNSDDLFTYKVTVTDANSSDGYVWFSAWDPNVRDTVYDFDVTGGNVTKETKGIPENATIDTEAGTCTFINEDGDEETHPIVEGENKYYTGYFYATNGAELTMKIKAGWNVRFLNVYHGTTYSFEELVDQMPEHYEFVKAEASTQYEIIRESNKIWNDIDAENPSPIVTGTIKEPNNNYTITYTNKVDGFFYIYHSSDNTVERIPLNDTRIVDGKFNIVNETKSGYLYGGYYKGYSKTTTTADQITGKAESGNLVYTEDTSAKATEYDGTHIGGFWATDTNGTVYEGDLTTWNKDDATNGAYTEKGNAMTPAVNTVYYLKEVPEAYLEPATYVVYDTHNEENGYFKV
ncbi:MAG: hypothetical protein IKF05_06645, partial [Erysipelotrichaceae bacterium]|nr:hypothetical protein [Erysipelotrichaceae bacterium]